MTIDPVITITKADIEAAKKVRKDFDDRKTWCYSRASSCPVAQALRRTYPLLQDVVIMSWGGWWGECVGKEPCSRVNTVFHQNFSDEARAFIALADKKKDRVRPRTLRLF